MTRHIHQHRGMGKRDNRKKNQTAEEKAAAKAKAEQKAGKQQAKHAKKQLQVAGAWSHTGAACLLLPVCVRVWVFNVSPIDMLAC